MSLVEAFRSEILLISRRKQFPTNKLYKARTSNPVLKPRVLALEN